MLFCHINYLETDIEGKKMNTHTQNHILRALFLIFIMMIISFSLPAFAKGDVFVNSKGVAIRGYDPVAYFVSAEAQKGKKEFSHVHAGNTWRFANQANKDAFISNPIAYLPQYGGHCAFAASKGSIASTDPKAWTIRDGKLYLNYSISVRKRWLRNVAENIVKADANWPTLSKKVKTY